MVYQVNDFSLSVVSDKTMRITHSIITVSLHPIGPEPSFSSAVFGMERRPFPQIGGADRPSTYQMVDAIPTPKHVEQHAYRIYMGLLKLISKYSACQLENNLPGRVLLYDHSQL